MLYDDGRWTGKKPTAVDDEPGNANNGPDEKSSDGRSSSGTGQKKKDISRRISSVEEETKMNVEKDLLRILAEIHLINAEVRSGENWFWL